MLDHHPAHDLLIDTILLPLHLRVPVHARPHGAIRPHRGRVPISAFPRYADSLKNRAVCARHQPRIGDGVREVEQPEAGVAALVRRRLDDAVDGRLVEAAREHLHRVARIDDLQAVHDSSQLTKEREVHGA